VPQERECTAAAPVALTATAAATTSLTKKSARPKVASVAATTSTMQDSTMGHHSNTAATHLAEQVTFDGHYTAAVVASGDPIRTGSAAASGQHPLGSSGQVTWFGAEAAYCCGVK
jgi:hypothetical protein